MIQWSVMDTNHKNNFKKIVIFGLVALCVAGFSIWHFISGLTRITTDDAYIEGRIHSIASKVPGTVIKVYVDDNRAVKKGGTLVELDISDYELKVNEAEAALEAERARLLDAEAGIKTAIAALKIQEVNFEQAELDKNRAEALFKEEVITKERSEKVLTAYNLAEAQVKAAREQLEKSKSLKTLEESLIKQKEATVNIAKLNLSYTTVTSPTDGYVTSKSAEAGNQIQAGQPLMAIIALDDIWLVANYKETQLKNVRPGQRVIIKVDTYPGKVFKGKVDSIMAGTGSSFSLFPPENALGNYVKVVQRIPVKIIFDRNSMDEQHVLRIGMSCIPTIITNE